MAGAVRAKVSADFLSGGTARRGDELLSDPPENKFRIGNRTGGLDNCGSAQHLLLLEEFYRSATRVAANGCYGR